MAAFTAGRENARQCRDLSAHQQIKLAVSFQEGHLPGLGKGTRFEPVDVNAAWKSGRIPRDVVVACPDRSVYRPVDFTTYDVIDDKLHLRRGRQVEVDPGRRIERIRIIRF